MDDRFLGLSGSHCFVRLLGWGPPSSDVRFRPLLQGLRSGVSAAVQSIIALVGAVGLQSGASESVERVQEKMKNRIAVIVGEDLDKKLTEQQQKERDRSMQVAASRKAIVDQPPVEVRLSGECKIVVAGGACSACRLRVPKKTF